MLHVYLRLVLTISAKREARRSLLIESANVHAVL
jgi:hypothetical protein